MYWLFRRMRTLALCSIGGSLTGCASFEAIHDPRFGAVSKEHLPKLIKSVQCELETFYTANGVLREALREERIALARHGQNRIALERVLALKHFDLDDEAYGAFSLDIKVQDSLALPGTSSSFVNVLNPAMGHTKNLALGPSVQAQGTYDNVLWFSVPQNATVAFKRLEIDEEQAKSVVFTHGAMTPEEEHLCYRRTVEGHYLELEQGKYPGLELFDRIQVDGVQTLADWLQENSSTMGVARNLLSDAHAQAEKPKRTPIPVADPFVKEAIDGGQLSYIFTVQYTGSLDVKFSLVSSRWNPATADLSGGVQQTGVLSIYVNGYQAAAAIGAKSALTAINAPAPQPTKVIIVEDDTKPKPPKQATKNVIKSLVENAVPAEMTQADPTNGKTKLGEFFTELDKSQVVPGQKEQTLSKLYQLKLPTDKEKDVVGAVEDLSVPPPAPRTRKITISPGPATTTNNNGRGGFRYPLAFPSP